MDELVEAVRKYAQEHYNDGGWDVIVECWDDDQLRRCLTDEAGYTPSTVEAVSHYASIYADRQADAAISSGEL